MESQWALLSYHGSSWAHPPNDVVKGGPPTDEIMSLPYEQKNISSVDHTFQILGLWWNPLRSKWGGSDVDSCFIKSR